MNLSVSEEFNSKMLTPELTEDQLSELHQELRDLYRMYCGPNAVDRIQFDDDIVRQLQDSKSRTRSILIE